MPVTYPSLLRSASPFRADMNCSRNMLLSGTVSSALPDVMNCRTGKGKMQIFHTNSEKSFDTSIFSM
ncbi:MAG: hypothetical protein N3D15_05300 [Syntrophorhabdaceae bacterium]|nr:hypothetical protein [Syntrophorhabdaceae bacterium]